MLADDSLLQAGYKDTGKQQSDANLTGNKTLCVLILQERGTRPDHNAQRKWSKALVARQTANAQIATLGARRVSQRGDGGRRDDPRVDILCIS